MGRFGAGGRRHRVGRPALRGRLRRCAARTRPGRAVRRRPRRGQRDLGHERRGGGGRGLDTALPELVRSLTARGIDAGHGRDSFASLIELIRERAQPG
ncbi:hypothetical protein ACFQYP_55760 [Nonomuraea antimicrobica]|uniref:imine reductase family protein n=1 Tax=Nonomuraea antimicrobica TaxID=561173 RepID=UPI00360803B5